MADHEKPQRMTVAKLGVKFDELQESVDELHNEMSEIKQVLKSLLEVQLNIQKEGQLKPENKDESYGMYN